MDLTGLIDGADESHNVRELLAEYAHVAWSGWMRYMLDNWDDEHLDRWRRQMDTDYHDLPEGEKESDRREADKILHILGISAW